MIGDLVSTPLDERLSNPRGKRIEDFIPGSALPFPGSAIPLALERVQDSLGVVDLVYGRGSFCAVPAARSGMKRVAFKLADLSGLLVYISQQTASGLAVEADR